jgi:hypothetical protein
MSTNEFGGGGGVDQECFVYYLENMKKLTQAKHSLYFEL